MQFKSAKFFNIHTKNNRIMNLISKIVYSKKGNDLTLHVRSDSLKDELFEIIDRLTAYQRLWNFAKERNDQKGAGSSRYFIGLSNDQAICNLGNFGVFKHIGVAYAGIIYFKDKADAIEAIKYFGDELYCLFNVHKMKYLF